jgi:hypothetical protein
MIGWVAALLTFRSILLSIIRSGGWTSRSLHVLKATLFGSIAFLLPPISYDPIPMIIGAVVVALSLAVALYDVSNHRGLIAVVHRGFFALFWIVSSLTITSEGITRWVEDQPIATITLTGKRLKKWVEWKNPLTDFRQGWVDAYEVILKTPKGEVLGTYFLYGDLVGIRARVLHFHPIWNFLGVKNLCSIEAIYTGYDTMERHQLLPHLGFPIALTQSWMGRILWRHIFTHSLTLIGVERASLDSSFFPLHDERGSPICGTFLFIAP